MVFAIHAVIVVVSIIAVCVTSDVLVSNCQDVNTCDPSTCTKRLSAKENVCTSLGSNNNSLLNASFATFHCLSTVQSCSPTKVYFNDSTCTGTPAETLWNPCGQCLQFPPRLQTCDVRNDSFVVRVQLCHDNSCNHCDPFDNSGLPPATCYAHPGVPGLYLEYNNLEACTGILVQGYDDDECKRPAAQTLMPGQGKCFGGISLKCSN